MSTYLYSPLPPEGEYIRLLSILPNEDETAALQCKLRNYSLQKLSIRTHLYEALSYVWGNPHETLPIHVDGEQFCVTVNLHAALSRLRDPSLQRILWVDAICINQENSEEQGQQVQLMAKVYSKAHRVIVWLGEAADFSNEALKAIYVATNEQSMSSSKEIIQQSILALKKYQDSSNNGRIQQTILDLQEIHGAADNQSTNPAIKMHQQAILNLIKRAWFHRIWVREQTIDYMLRQY